MSQSLEEKNARKFWWILMLLPIGLVVGSVTSVVNHLRQNSDNESQVEFQVKVEMSAKDIYSTMVGALLIGKRDINTTIGKKNIQAVSRFIQGAVSPAGTGLPFKEILIQNIDGKKLPYAYADIEGINKDELVIVVIELVGDKSKSDAAKLALTPSLIRSLIESNTLGTIRFILSPETHEAQQHTANFERNGLILKNDKLKKLVVLKEQNELLISDPDNWKIAGQKNTDINLINSKKSINITHPILYKDLSQEISTKFSKATLTAAEQLRSLLIQWAN